MKPICEPDAGAAPPAHDLPAQNPSVGIERQHPMTMLTARRCQHHRTTCEDPKCGHTMTDRRNEIAVFEKADDDGNVAVLIGRKLAGKLHHRDNTHVFLHHPAHPEAAGWKPETDELATLHGLNMGRTTTTAKDHVLAFRAGQLGWDWAVQTALQLQRTWYARGQYAHE